MKKLFTICTILASTFLGFAQESNEVLYLNERMETVKKKHATYTRTLKSISDNLFEVQINYLNGKNKMTGIFSNVSNDIEEDGLFHYYFADGSLESTGYYKAGQKRGTWKRFESDGIPKPDRYYEALSSEDMAEIILE